MTDPRQKTFSTVETRGVCIQGNPKLREGHGQLETEIDVRRLGAAESKTGFFNRSNFACGHNFSLVYKHVQSHSVTTPS